MTSRIEATNNHLKVPRINATPRQAIASCRKHQEMQTTAMDNDPSAGSPTETLLRLLLPLNDQV